MWLLSGIPHPEAHLRIAVRELGTVAIRVAVMKGAKATRSRQRGEGEKKEDRYPIHDSDGLHAACRIGLVQLHDFQSGLLAQGPVSGRRRPRNGTTREG